MTRRFHWLLSGLLLSRFGTNIYTLALPWIAYDLTGSSVILGTMFAVEMLPFILLMPFGGVLIDRYDRRKIMVLSDIARTLVVLGIPLLAWLDHLSVAYLFATGFILSTFSFFVDVSLLAVIPKLVSAEHLTRANGRVQLIENMARLGGPLLAGALIALLGAYAALLLNSAAYLAMAVCVLLIGAFDSDRARTAAHTVRQEMKDGFEFLLRHVNVRAIAVISVLCNLGMGIVLSTLIFYLRDVLHTDEWRTGIVFSAIGIFGIAGSLVVEPLAKRFSRGRLIGALLLFGGTVGAVLIALLPTWWTAALGIGLWGGSLTTMVVLLNTYKQEAIDNSMLGRVEGCLTSVSYVSLPLAGLIGGYGMEAFGPQPTYLIAAGAVLLAALVAYVSPLRKI